MSTIESSVGCSNNVEHKWLCLVKYYIPIKCSIHCKVRIVTYINRANHCRTCCETLPHYIHVTDIYIYIYIKWKCASMYGVIFALTYKTTILYTS